MPIVPSGATDEGWGTGNAFVYITEDPEVDGLGEPLFHTTFFDPEYDES